MVKVHLKNYPIRCWESARNYKADDVALKGQPASIPHGHCSVSKFPTSKKVPGHKIATADKMTVAWNPKSCKIETT